jgi:RNA polymerase sigma-70 factor (ECF subfamily)
MPPRDTPQAIPPSGVDRFATTHWSLVIAAGNRQSADSAGALVSLCESYWYPLYAFIRRQGYSADDAQDLTQGFFARLLEKNYLGDADQSRGKFRSFLLAAAKHFLANERDRAAARKRGGGRTLVSLDFATAEGRYGREPVDAATPEALFARRWALTLLERVLDRLQDDYTAAGNVALFEGLKPFLAPDGSGTTYAELGRQLGMSEGAVKVAVHRLRKRYRRLLEDEIAHTVTEACEVEDEIRELFSAVGRKPG